MQPHVVGQGFAHVGHHGNAWKLAQQARLINTQAIPQIDTGASIRGEIATETVHSAHAVLPWDQALPVSLPATYKI